MTTTLEEYTQLISTGRHYVRRPDLTDVPGWATLPKPLAAAVTARTKAIKAWESARAALGEALRALEGADLADAAAIKAAAQAGKALPAPINQADLARTTRIQHRADPCRPGDRRHHRASRPSSHDQARPRTGPAGHRTRPHSTDRPQGQGRPDAGRPRRSWGLVPHRSRGHPRHPGHRRQGHDVPVAEHHRRPQVGDRPPRSGRHPRPDRDVLEARGWGEGGSHTQGVTK